jgi:aspartyl-tRNA(Asn)/glutamyl-tRNA(Gln) amidotransferase subunit A
MEKRLLTRRRLLIGAATATAMVAGTTTARAQSKATAVVVARPARDRLEDAIARITDPKGEGARACLTVYLESARAAADSADARARAGITLGPLDGAIISIKDLFDVAGEPTRAGSKVLADAPPATSDAPVVRRLRAAGSVIVAKTNMTEFAFSVIGINSHYGTPGNPVDRTLVPGGSTAGGAVAVADGMCEIAIGSDTGGSLRIPAAFCGIVGFKPSKYRVPAEGAFPLSYTLDSIGPMAKSVNQCGLADAVLSASEPTAVEPHRLSGLRIGIPQGRLVESPDATVSARFSEAIKALGGAGAQLSDESLSLLDDMAKVNAKGAITPIESYAIHRDRLATRANDYDPFVRNRIEASRNASAADYLALIRGRTELVRRMDDRLSEIDALALPTSPIVAPKIDEVSSSFEAFLAKQNIAIRNTAVVNFFDLCAISIPLPRSGGLPVGLMLVARNGHDRNLLRIGAAVERLFRA